MLPGDAGTIAPGVVLPDVEDLALLSLWLPELTARVLVKTLNAAAEKPAVMSS